MFGMWTHIEWVLNKVKTREGFVTISVFLFMLGAYNVKHAASLIFMTLFFLSIYTLFKPIEKVQLTKMEKYVFIFLMIYFLWFVITSLVSGWEYNQTKQLGLELRFILAIPIYILLRQIKGLLLPLWYGVTLSLWLAFIVVMYQVYVLEIAAAGGYGKLLLGPMSVLYIFMFLARKDWASNIQLKIFSVMTVLVGIVPVALSGARTAYTMLVALALIWVVVNYSWRKQLILMSGLVCVLSGIYFGSDTVKSGVNRAIDSAIQYSTSANNLSRRALGSTGQRLEMMKAAYVIAHDNPIFGIGSGNLEEASKKYIEKGLYHHQIGGYKHLHSAYADNLAKKGIPGLLLTLAMFFVPLWYFFKKKKIYYFPAAVGFYFIAGEIVAGLTIVAPVERGNFVAISLLIASICFSEIVRNIDNKEKVV